LNKCEDDVLVDAVENRKDIRFGKLTGVLTSVMVLYTSV